MAERFLESGRLRAFETGHCPKDNILNPIEIGLNQLQLRDSRLRGGPVQPITRPLGSLERFDRRSQHRSKLRQHAPEFRTPVLPFQSRQPVQQIDVYRIQRDRHTCDSRTLRYDHARIV
ncbi:MAG: hypothetical protein QM804_15715 [Propionicimonas sp.]